MENKNNENSDIYLIAGLMDLVDITKESKEYWDEKVPMLSMEECGELIQAISKMERRGNSSDKINLYYEIRDVLISIGMLINYYDLKEKSVIDMVKTKLKTKKDS